MAANNVNIASRDVMTRYDDVPSIAPQRSAPQLDVPPQRGRGNAPWETTGGGPSAAHQLAPTNKVSMKEFFFRNQAKHNAPPPHVTGRSAEPASRHGLLHCEDPSCTRTFYMWGRHHCRNCGSSVCDDHFDRPLCAVCVVAMGPADRTRMQSLDRRSL